MRCKEKGGRRKEGGHLDVVGASALVDCQDMVAVWVVGNLQVVWEALRL